MQKAHTCTWNYQTISWTRFLWNVSSLFSVAVVVVVEKHVYWRCIPVRRCSWHTTGAWVQRSEYGRLNEEWPIDIAAYGCCVYESINRNNKSISMPFNRQHLRLAAPNSSYYRTAYLNAFAAIYVYDLYRSFQHIPFRCEPIYIFGKLCLNDCCRYAICQDDEARIKCHSSERECAAFPFETNFTSTKSPLPSFSNYDICAEADGNRAMPMQTIGLTITFFRIYNSSFPFVYFFADMDFGGFPHDWAIGWLASSVAETEAIESIKVIYCVISDGTLKTVSDGNK